MSFFTECAQLICCIAICMDLDPHNKLDLDPELHQFADDKPKWNINLFGHFFKGLSIYLEARIWIWIRIRVKSHIRIRIRIK
jgi:hypothetical protein